LAEWLYEAGIGENRAALVEDDTILEAAIELPGGLRANAIMAGRLVAILVPGRRGIARFPDGSEALVEPLDPAVTEGASIQVQIVREAIPEAGRPRLPKARLSDEAPRPGPTLEERLRASGLPSHLFPRTAPIASNRRAGPSCWRRRPVARSPFPAVRCA
jgi:hypothetical protein